MCGGKVTVLTEDLAVAEAIAQQGMCVILMDGWAAPVSREIFQENPVALENAVRRSAARLAEQGILEIVDWRVYRLGEVWIKCAAGARPVRCDEGPRPARAYVLSLPAFLAARSGAAA